MIAINTNVLVRYLLQDSEAQTAGEAPLAKGADFPDALIVVDALRLASDDGESLTPTMPPCGLFRGPHCSRDRPARFRICRPTMNLVLRLPLPLPPFTAAARYVSQNQDSASLRLCAATHRPHHVASGPTTPAAQEASGRGGLCVCARLLHRGQVRRGWVFPYATRPQGSAPVGRHRDACFEREANRHGPSA